MSKHYSLTVQSRLVFGLCMLGLLFAAATRNVRADEIAVWNFNDSDLIVDHGAGLLTTNFNLTNLVFTLGGTTINARQGDTAGQSLTLQSGTNNANNGHFINIATSTLGFTGIRISFATQGTGTGFNSNQLQYSLDGVNFVDFGLPYTPATSFGLMSFDLSGVKGLSDNPNAAFRIVFNGATSSTGNNRIDNFVIEGQHPSTAVPEAETAILFLLGLTGTVFRRVGRTLRKGWIRPDGYHSKV